ncbi:FCD domain-containing protein [Paraburkholderia sp. SARCC-3016]|uniref:FCD domain-containing protein n=1 Tax=Paraburkholderia sp. SARCC-3016 TaxID=3058611 RepID=UPI00280913E8|nr:FCD domain-containing protein [Paraburkholderia sp. SARCC-3016]MDQ7978840.1 FCD domain-containing protein [Paraburkholderia sp. SARCC-3016]
MDIKVTPQTVLLQTTLKLREAIMQGHFAPGERLVELTLCERIGVSRTTVREALRRLESERLVTNVPNRGPSVAIISRSEADQIYHVRKLLEGEAAALFATLASPAQIADLERTLRSFEAAVKNESAVDRVRSTSEFYEVILNGCGNLVIHEVLGSLLARINVLRAKSMANPGRSRHSLAEMRRILNAVSKRDAVAARSAAEAHVMAARDAAQLALGDDAGDGRDAGDGGNRHEKKRDMSAAGGNAPAAAAPRAVRGTAAKAGKPLIDNTLWAQLEPLLPPAKPRRYQYPGRKPVSDRQAMNGILFVLANRIHWNELPAELGCGSGISCWRRLRNWQDAGAWARMQQVLERSALAGRLDFVRATGSTPRAGGEARLPERAASPRRAQKAAMAVAPRARPAARRRAS